MVKPTAVITDNERTVHVHRDLAGELAVISAAILDTREEKKRAASEFTERIKDLEKQQRELITQIRSGPTQMSIDFREKVEAIKVTASEAAKKVAQEAETREGGDANPFEDDDQDEADDTDKVLEH
jgi:hypothetical protein